MVLGDAVVSASVSITAGSTSTIRPGSGVEWIIHNIYTATTVTVELYATDGSNPILVDTSYGGGWMNHFFHLTNDQYFYIKNVGATTIYMKYDGIVSK